MIVGDFAVASMTCVLTIKNIPTTEKNGALSPSISKVMRRQANPTVARPGACSHVAVQT